MKPIALRRGEAAAATLDGRIACHDVRDPQGRVAIRKGQTLDAEAARLLLTLPWEEVHVLELEPGDVHEEPPRARLAPAAQAHSSTFLTTLSAMASGVTFAFATTSPASTGWRS